MNTRYGHSSTGGGNQDQGERKDEGWESRQGGSQTRHEGRKGDPTPPEQPGDDDRRTQPPAGTNTQGELAGIREASRETERDGPPSAERESSSSGTDQPRRMGGPLGPDPKHPHLPEGAQTPDTQGTGAGGFDRGVNATQVGAVHQGVKEERD